MKKFFSKVYDDINKSKIVLISLFIFWVFFTLTSPYMHEFNTDEIWAYVLAKYLNFIEIIKIMHYEGHTFLWYFVLKSFTYFDTLYPGIIKYLNWFFCMLSVILLFKYSPIKNIYKIFIIFSTPFLVMYPILGRCYGLAIFLLFVIVILYKNRLKHPIILSSIIFLATNTHVNTAFVTFTISCFFIYDLLKSNNFEFKKKNVLIPISIVAMGFFMLVLQWIPIHIPKYLSYYGKFYFFKEFFFPAKASVLYKLVLFIVYIPLSQIVAMIFIKNMKDMRAIIFVFLITNMMFMFNLFLSSGRPYHFYFLYIVLVMLYWLLLDNSAEFRDNKILYGSLSIYLIVISIVFNCWVSKIYPWFEDFNEIDNSITKIVNYIPKGSTVYLIPDRAQNAIFTLEKYYNLKNGFNEKIPSYKAFTNIYQKAYFDPQKIKLKENEEAYFVIANNFIYQYKYFLNIKDLPDNCLDIDMRYIVCKLPIKSSKNRFNRCKTINKLNYTNINCKTLVGKDYLLSTANNNINELVPQNANIYLSMDVNDSILQVLNKNKKYKLKELNLKSLKYLNKFNFIMPYDVKFNKNEINYYLISKPYFLRFFDYTQIPQNCYNIVDSYVLCKLPMQKDFLYSPKYIGRERHPKSEFWAKFYAYEINE